ncbi:helix-turn-helix domain-containing protein [Nonomuraea sp. NPDC050202]
MPALGYHRRHAGHVPEPVTVTVGRLRRRPGDPPIIATARGAGYRVA